MKIKSMLLPLITCLQLGNVCTNESPRIAPLSAQCKQSAKAALHLLQSFTKDRHVNDYTLIMTKDPTQDLIKFAIESDDPSPQEAGQQEGTSDPFCDIITRTAEGDSLCKCLFKTDKVICILKKHGTGSAYTMMAPLLSPLTDRFKRNHPQPIIEQTTSCLVIPLKHRPIEAHQLSDEEFVTLVEAAFFAARLLGSPEKFMIQINNGHRQTVRHLHLHVRINQPSSLPFSLHTALDTALLPEGNYLAPIFAKSYTDGDSSQKSPQALKKSYLPLPLFSTPALYFGSRNYLRFPIRRGAARSTLFASIGLTALWQFASSRGPRR